MKKCTNCNQTYQDNMKFCSNCGSALIEINETNSQAQTGYYTQNNNGTFNTQQNYYPNSGMNNSQNGGNAYNPSNSYSTGNNPNPTEEGGIIPWLPLILSIVSFFIFGFTSIVAFVLLIRNKHVYKYPNIAKILSIIAMVLWAIGVIASL